MTDHITHFDDCGCKSAAYEKRIGELEAEVELVEGVLRRHTEFECVSDVRHEWTRAGILACPDCVLTLADIIADYEAESK